MSTTVKSKPTTTNTVKAASQKLGLYDAKRLSLAILVAANDELANPTFAERVREAYAALPQTGATSRNSTGQNALTMELVPVKHVEGLSMNPAVPLDPYLLNEAYGPQQLNKILDLFPVSKLKEGVERVKSQNPNTKPTNGRAKAAIIEYIMRYVAEKQ